MMMLALNPIALFGVSVILTALAIAAYRAAVAVALRTVQLGRVLWSGRILEDATEEVVEVLDTVESGPYRTPGRLVKQAEDLIFEDTHVYRLQADDVQGVPIRVKVFGTLAEAMASASALKSLSSTRPNMCLEHIYVHEYPNGLRGEKYLRFSSRLYDMTWGSFYFDCTPSPDSWTWTWPNSSVKTHMVWEQWNKVR
jgi:hypothetical protein